MFKVPCTCDAGATEPFRKRMVLRTLDQPVVDVSSAAATEARIAS